MERLVPADVPGVLLSPRQQSLVVFTLHGHLVEMYGGFQKAVRSLSLLSCAPKCPASYGSATDDEIRSTWRASLV